MGLLKRGEAYVQAIAEYCQQTGQSPDHVLQSKKDMLGIMEKVYGSFDAYVTEKEKGIKIRSAVEALEKLEALPLEFMVPVLLEHKAGVDMEVLFELGVDPGYVGRVAQMYVRDVAKFGKAFLEETRKYEAKELKQYKQLAQQR